MTELSQVLENIQRLRNQREAERITSNTLTAGSPTNAGPLITPSTMPRVATPLAIREEANQAAMSITPAASLKNEPSEPLDWRKYPISESVDAQNELTAILTRVHIIQKRYGEPADHFQVRDAAFQKALGRFSIDAVHEAFNVYITRRSDVPAVADILHILEPPPPVYDKATYIGIKQKIKSDVFVSDQEKQYCRFYEQQQINKVVQWEQHQQRLKAAGRTPAKITYALAQD